MTEKYHVDGWIQLTISINNLIDAESLTNAKHEMLEVIGNQLKAYPNVNIQDYDLYSTLCEDE